MTVFRLNRRSLLLGVPGFAVGWAHRVEAIDAPAPIVFPRDDGPHVAPVEWWYFTGHLFTEVGDRYGFEFVVFKAHQGGITGYASHFAITDSAAGQFRYDQRLGFAPINAEAPTDAGFDLKAADWSMIGLGDNAQLQASMDDYAIDLALTSTKPPVLHDSDGYIDYGNSGASYYYSRTRLDVAGTLRVAGIDADVIGIAWFDHQWGAFTTYKTGGWDWFALQFCDNTELMLYIVRTAGSSETIVDGTFVARDGTLTVLERGDFSIAETGSWTSPATGVTYPVGWNIAVPMLGIDLALTAAITDQELDTRSSTGVIYWEGEVTVEGARDGLPITGLGYVELTGRSPVEPVAMPDN